MIVPTFGAVSMGYQSLILPILFAQRPKKFTGSIKGAMCCSPFDVMREPEHLRPIRRSIPRGKYEREWRFPA